MHHCEEIDHNQGQNMVSHSQSAEPLENRIAGKKVLVTGAGGFIGSHLCEELLRAGASVRAMVRYNSMESHGLLERLEPDVYGELEVISGDVRDSDSVRKAISGCSIVFHLAALIGIPYSYNAPKSYVETNVLGTLNVMQTCLNSSIERVVHTSTSEVYGTAIYTPIDEDHPLQGQSPYSASKIAADKIAESYFLSFDLPVVVTRPFNCYGPRQSSRAFIPAMISQILREPVVKCGLLAPYRDYTFVKDTVAGFIACAVTSGIEGMTVNVGSGKKISMGDLLHRIMEKMNIHKDTTLEHDRLRPKRSEVMALICDNTRARTLMKWNPRCSLDEGLDEVIEYVKSNSNNYKTNHFVV